jgi:hypothetical protein
LEKLFGNFSLLLRTCLEGCLRVKDLVPGVEEDAVLGDDQEPLFLLVDDGAVQDEVLRLLDVPLLGVAAQGRLENLVLSPELPRVLLVDYDGVFG